MTDTPHPPSPCNDLCRIDPQTGLCEGCGRTLDEISEWGYMTAEQKRAVIERLGKERAHGEQTDGG
jgi:predicted Fe-S protein YdhL (DUF1289 family)